MLKSIWSIKLWIEAKTHKQNNQTSEIIILSFNISILADRLVPETIDNQLNKELYTLFMLLYRLVMFRTWFELISINGKVDKMFIYWQKVEYVLYFCKIIFWKIMPNGCGTHISYIIFQRTIEHRTAKRYEKSIVLFKRHPNFFSLRTAQLQL